MYKITRQLYIVEPIKSTEKIVAASSEAKRLYENFGEALMVATKDLFKTYSKCLMECEVLFLKKRVRVRGVVTTLKNLRVVRYVKNLGLKEEKNSLFLSEYVFEENEVDEGEPAVLIKDITKKPSLLD